MTIQVEAFPPAPGGMNTAIPAWEIDDTEAQYVQDALMDKPGLLRRRGPVRAVIGMAQPGYPITSLCMTLDPAGNTRFGALNGDTTHGRFDAWSNDGTTTVPLTWPHPLPNDPASGLATAYRHANARAALLGGTWVGASDRVDANAPTQGLALWRGGNTPNYSTGTVSVATGSNAVTGVGTAWLASASIGQFLFASTDGGLTLALIGVVRQIVSDTSIVLKEISPYTATAKAYQLQAIRGFAPKVGTGLVTCTTTATTVNGGDTKFKSQGLATGTWNLYRRSDLVWVGKVSSVATEIQLTLVANAAIALADEPYIALKGDADFAIETTASDQKVGWLSAVYAERNFYANNGAQFEKTYRLWYSDTDDPELVDMSPDGSWIPVDSTGDINEPIRGLGPAYNAMIVLKDTETFALYGTSPATFTVKKLWDDGTLGGGSMQLYGGGVIWAGQQGINFYDGVTVSNLTIGKLGEVWKNSVQTFDPARYRMYSMVIHDHYFLHIEKLQPTIRVVKGATPSVPTRWTVAINMVSRAVSLNTNLNMRGAVRLPTEAADQVWYAANSSTAGHVCIGDALFNTEGVDDFSCDNDGIIGPDFYFESKKFNQGDPLLLKRFKQLAIYYLVQGGSIKLDTVVGLNDLGTASVTDFPASVYTWTTVSNTVHSWTTLKASFATWTDLIQGVYVPKRIRFLKRNQNFSFRLYQSSSSVARLRLGPFEIGWKNMRPGRV